MITAETFRALPRKEQTDLLKQLTDAEAMTLLYDWSFWARPDQIQPSQLGVNGKFIWMPLAGRGWGKTRTGAEWVIEKVQAGYTRISLVGAAADEVRDVMIEGESGILACSPPWFMPEYIPSKKLIIWPSGARASIYYGTEPEKSRGAQSDLVWMDELCKYQYPQETYDNIMFGLRLGDNPLCLITTTPKPIQIIRELSKDERCVVTRGKTTDNVRNLAKPFIDSIIRKYDGTRLGRQELDGEILDDNPYALWKRSNIDRTRIKPEQMPDLRRIIIPIDPAVTSNEGSDDTGIIPVGEGRAPDIENVQNPDLTHYYVLEDVTLKGTPLEWGASAVDRYRYWRADKIIAEVNNGGDLVEANIRNIDRSVPYDKVHASRGKYVRAEPIAALYEQGRVHHVGFFPSLEDELCEWVPGEKSPNRLDSLVWGISYMSEKGNDRAEVFKNNFVR